MNRALGLMLAAAIAASGCGDNFEAPPLTPAQLLTQLRQLPGVDVQKKPTDRADYHHFILKFTQPVDHNDPSQGTFEQLVSLLHRDERRRVPMIIHTSGYSEYQADRPVELAQLLAANQVSIEHRFFADSRPKVIDWTKLTIEQMAADQHAIIEALRTIYEGPFLSTGASKGGMTAIFHRRYYPDDVDGTVAYVAPISFGAPDKRYPPFFDTVGPVDCREKVRAAATRMLSISREAMCARAELQVGPTGPHYTRIALGPAVEAAILGLEWTFWQYSGVSLCDQVPGPDASEETLFGFLNKISPVSDYADAKLAYLEPYYYQAHSQLGYPDAGAHYLLPFLWFTEEDYAGELPAGAEPAYDDKVMQDIDNFVERAGHRLLFVYGEWDPWTKGKFVLGVATDSAVVIQAKGTHRARIVNLGLADRERVFAKLRAWTGVEPMLPRVPPTVTSAIERDEPRPPHMPSAMLRALRARK